MGPYGVSALRNGALAGYSSRGNNLIVQNIRMNDVRNGSNFSCMINITRALLHQDDPTFLYVAGEYQYKICTYVYKCMLFPIHKNKSITDLSQSFNICSYVLIFVTEL